MTSAPTQAWGYGLATIDTAGTVLDVWFPAPALGAAPGDNGAPGELTELEGSDHARGVRREVLFVEISDLLDAPPADTPDAYLRLHLLSHRLVFAPASWNLDGVFAVLPNNVWTGPGPRPPEDFERTCGSLCAARGRSRSPCRASTSSRG